MFVFHVLQCLLLKLTSLTALEVIKVLFTLQPFNFGPLLNFTVSVKCSRV